MISSENFDVIPLFPEAGLYITKINVDNNKIMNYVKNSQFKLTNNSKNKDAKTAYISEDLNVFKNLNFLKNKIDKEIKCYLFNVLEHNLNYKFINSWITKTEPNGFSQKHSHANTFLSGVYYPVGCEGFNIKFYRGKNNFWSINKNLNNILNMESFILSIKENNTLILFPSDLKHSIEINESDADRYSIAFNINPKGFIGDNDCKVFF